MTLRKTSQMRKYITKPNSRTDKVILFVLSMTSFMNCNVFCSTYIDIWWLNLIISLVCVVIVTSTTSVLYWNLYNEVHVKNRLLDKVHKYGKLRTPYWHLSTKEFAYDSILKNAPNVIDDICKATLIPIDERKKLFDAVCNIWTEEGKEIPPFITEKWKKAVIEYKKYEIWMD